MARMHLQPLLSLTHAIAILETQHRRRCCSEQRTLHRFLRALFQRRINLELVQQPPHQLSVLNLASPIRSHRLCEHGSQRLLETVHRNPRLLRAVSETAVLWCVKYDHAVLPRVSRQRLLVHAASCLHALARPASDDPIKHLLSYQKFPYNQLYHY